MSKHQSDRDKTVSRRGFLKLATSVGVAGSATALSGCLINDKQAGGKGWMPKQYNVPGTWPVQVKGRVPIDPKNPSIVRDDKKCVLCGQCLEICQKQTVYGAYELPVKDDFVCIHCGQCALWCPTAAISERDDTARVAAALKDPKKLVIVQTAPATRVGLGEEFGLPPGSWVQGQQVAALKALGFHKVLDTNFTADLTIMEEGSELVKRLTEKSAGEPLPQLTSCCPGWVKFVEYYYPELIPNLSTAKSPQQMLGSLAKTYYAKAVGKAPEDIFSVSIMPCTAKKWECTRTELDAAGRFNKSSATIRDVDAVLTVRELANMMKTANIDPGKLKEQSYDSLLGEGSSAALIFGNSGGVMEAAVRGAYFLVTKKQAPKEAFELQAVRGLAGVKEASVDVPGVGALKVAVASGTKNARVLLDRVKKGEASYHFIEVMACPGGCISGGGMPRTAVPPSDEVRAKRTACIVNKDATSTFRESYKNQEVNKLYETFLEEPLGHKSHELLHTKYISRSDKLKAKKPV